MKLSRRSFLEVAGAAGAAALAAPALARGEEPGGSETPGADEASVLVDTTLCAGCRACEAACAEKNRLPAPPEGPGVLERKRETTTTALTVVNRFDVDPVGAGLRQQPEGDATRRAARFAKSQCMHCVAPGCASACPNRALDKKPNGPVTYDPSRCMGCRYCMVACPFGVPRYEYEALAPRVVKCSFCADRQARGLAPACVSVCPTGALTFGRRAEVLAEARRRVFGNPGKYVPHVYGEHEAGGTNWLYVSDVPFEKLAMKTGLLEERYPDLVRGALGVPPFVMTLWPPLLMGFWAFSNRRAEQQGREAPREAEADGREDRHE